MAVHRIPPENLWTSTALYVAVTFMSVQHHRSILSAKSSETELGEALNDKEVYLKSDRGTQLVL